MMGILTPPVFEKFFGYMNDPTDAYVQQEGGEFYFPAEGFGRARVELDLVVAGPPPGAPGQQLVWFAGCERGSRSRAPAK